MNKAILVGYHGHKNLGDDIFREIIFNWLFKALAVDKCAITAANGSVNSLKNFEVECISAPIKNVNRSVWLPIFLRAFKGDYLIFSAGSIFTIQPFFILYSTLFLLRLLRPKLKIYAIGISVGPFKSDFDKYWCLKSFSLMHKVLLRDKRSEKILEASKHKIKYKLSYDLALSYGNYFGEYKKADNTSNILGVSLTARGFVACSEEHSDICNMYVDLFKKILDSEYKVNIRLFSVCTDKDFGDMALCNHIQERLDKYSDRISIVAYDNDVEGHLLSLSECSAVIATRMHAGVMAILSHVPVYQVSYAEKITEFYSHTNLSEKYLECSSQLSMGNIYQFIEDAFEGKLAGFVEAQRRILNERGMDVVKDLEVLSET